MCNISQNKSRTTTGVPLCVRCGYCCSKMACGYGEDNGHGDCKFLKVKNLKFGTFTCAKRDEIMEIEKNSSVPMFDNYCSSSMFNEVREEVIGRIKDKV